MRSCSLRPTLLCSLLGCSVLVGCHHDERACPTCGGQPRAALTVPGPAVAAVPMPVSPYAGIPSGPVTHEVLRPTPAQETASLDNQEWQAVSGKVREKLMERRTFTDLTVNPAFAHAPDYSWLVGELRAIGPDVWSVRFASVDEDRDTVVLVDAPPIINLKPGQLVRVEGQLADPSSHDAKPAYRVTSIRAADHE
jgi:hypothetical protein